MSDVVGAALLFTGVTFLVLASIGIVRMPDLFTRMSAGTKGSTLGIACVLLAAAVHFGTVGILARALATAAFFLVTAPVAAHVIARAGYAVGVPLWEGTLVDELRPHVRRRPGQRTTQVDAYVPEEGPEDSSRET